MGQKINRVGETAQMKNGQSAIIINYQNAKDIDVQFEDKTIVTHKTYNEFKRKEIRNPNYQPPNKFEVERVGETRIMASGMKATIIAYRNSTDIDVQFENGIIREHARYGHFLSGKIHPIYLDDRKNNDKNKRVGEKRMMNCGLEATIIEYIDSHNVTIQFEDGSILTKRYYRDFVNGLIQHQSNTPIATPRSKRLGQTKPMTCGQMATVIAYRNSSDVDIQFEDGTIRDHVEYRSFYNGKLRHPNTLIKALAQERVGEINKMNNGFTAEIIAYRSYCDIDVKFDDGTIVTGYRYEKFKNGEIPHPKIKYKSSISLQEFAIDYYLRELGFRKIQQGEWSKKGFGRFELDFYHPEKNIAIEYDGGVHNNPNSVKRDIRKNKRCKKLGIQLYRLRDQYCKDLNDSDSIIYKLSYSKKIMAGMINCKEEIEKILVDNNIPFDINFIDFIRDRDKILDEYNTTYINHDAKNRLGKSIYNEPEKQMMTIVKYNSSTDIDVQFEDGKIRYNTTYSSFIKGNLRHPDKMPKFLKSQRLGEQRTMSNGMIATIIRYNLSRDIDVQFEDGAIVKNKDYDDFVLGHIRHPNKK